MVSGPDPQPRSQSRLAWLREQLRAPTTAHVEPLARCIEEWIRALLVAGDAFLILEIDDRYAQFLVLDGTYLRAEVVGDHYASNHRGYTSEETAMLARLGWLHPDTEFIDQPEIEPAERSKNYWRDWEPADTAAAAALVALTLTTVLGLKDTNLRQLDVTIGSPDIEKTP